MDLAKELALQRQTWKSMIPAAAVSRHPYGFLIVRLGATIDGAQVRFNIWLKEEAARTAAELADPLTRNSDVQLHCSGLFREHDLAGTQVWIWRSALSRVLHKDHVNSDKKRHPDFWGANGLRDHQARQAI